MMRRFKFSHAIAAVLLAAMFLFLIVVPMLPGYDPIPRIWPEV